MAAAMSSLIPHAEASGYVPGQKLPPEELSKLSDATKVRLGGQDFRVVPGTLSALSARSAGTTAKAESMVVNARGVVGISRNEVVISQVPTETVRQVAGKLSPAAMQAQYYDHTDISALKFGSFQEAVSARDQLKKLLPDGASVDVPIRYGQPRAR